MIGRVVDLLLLPPCSLFLLLGAGLLLRRRCPGAAAFLRILSLSLLLLLSLPIVAASLLRSLQTEAPLADPAGAQAIVVLSGDTQPWAPEYRAATLGPMTLERVRYAARLSKETRLPILVSGGRSDPDVPPAAHLMRDALAGEFGAEVRFVEAESRTTRENAERSAALLRKEGISRVLLVTHAWHMPRSLAAFRRAGLDALPAPTAFREWPKIGPGAFLPSGRSMRESNLAIHEWIGRLWYALSG